MKPPPPGEFEALLHDTERGAAKCQRVTWDYDAWVRSLRLCPHREVTISTLEALEDAWALERGISRRAVVEIGGGDPTKLLITSMAWGYGDRPYGPARVAKMLKTANLEQVLIEVQSRAQSGTRDGFTALFKKRKPRITNLGVAMGSKFLYFAAGARTDESRPLVYDQNVYWALKNLSDAKPDAPDPDGYVSSDAYAASSTSWSRRRNIPI